MKQYNQFEDTIIKEHYPTGGCRIVKKYIDRSTDSIRHRAIKLNINREKTFRESKIDFSELTTNFNVNSSYLLGLIWGDGTVNHDNRHYHVSVTLQENDFNELMKLGIFNKFKIYKVKKYKESWKQTYTAQIGHKNLVLFLYDNDFKNKSIKSPIKILHKIPKKYHIYFIRGWYDADGCSAGLNRDNWAINICGSHKQNWKALENFCSEYNIKFRIIRRLSKKGNSSIFYISRIKNVNKFLSLIYKDNIPCLSRKYNSFINAKKRMINKYKDNIEKLNKYELYDK